MRDLRVVKLSVGPMDNNSPWMKMMSCRRVCETTFQISATHPVTDRVLRRC
jgi:hypothetical protein